MEDKKEVEDELKPRTAQETAQRMLALLAVVGKVYEPDGSITWMQRHRLEQYLSPAELAFMQEKSPSELSRVAFSWRAEAIASLIWALGGLSEMPPLNQQFDVFENNMVKSAIKEPHDFIARAQLRSTEEINNMEHFLYHQHWRVRDAALGGIGKLLEPFPDDPPIQELDHGIVYERRYGLSWLAGWGTDWDNVPTDT